MKKRAIIIGAGVGGLATACILGHAGYEVTIYEKNFSPGGKAGVLEDEGFRFDTGPNWLLMPDIISEFYSLLDENVDEQLDLIKLKPSYRLFFKDQLFGAVDITGNIDQDGATLESLEPGARTKLLAYLEKSAEQYSIAKEHFLYKSFDSPADLLYKGMLPGFKLNILTSMSKYVGKYFSSEEARKIMQYPLLFLGVNPASAPAMYNILNHVDFNQGIYYPRGGIYKLVESLVTMAKARGVKIIYRQSVASIRTKNGVVSGVILENGEKIDADIVVSNTDRAYSEINLLDRNHSSYPEDYWSKKTMSPSAMLIYLGVKDTYPNLRHHNLVFSKDWAANFRDVFSHGTWPNDPSFYVCNSNKTDSGTAPKKRENLIVHVPLPASLDYSDEKLEEYSRQIINTMERTMHLDKLSSRIIYKKVVGAKHFQEQFNSYRGSAMGLAHTFRQTGPFRPLNYSKKVKNLYYTGADTSPGIGIPMCLISAQLVYKRLLRDRTSARMTRVY